jgi:hypothetical protein
VFKHDVLQGMLNLNLLHSMHSSTPALVPARESTFINALQWLVLLAPSHGWL